MPDSFDEWLPLWPDAAERYSPKLFADWKAAAVLLNNRPQRRGELIMMNMRTGGRSVVDEDALFRQAEWEAKRAVLRDLGDQLRRGELVAIGDHVERGRLLKHDVVPAWWFDWDYWGGRCGERIRFGDAEAKYFVHKLRVGEMVPVQGGAGPIPVAANLASKPVPAPRSHVNQIANKLLDQNPDWKKLTVTDAARNIAELMDPKPLVETVRRYIGPKFSKHKRKPAKH